LEDHFGDAGPLAGIECALEVISTPLLAVDMPKMKLSQLRMLIAQCTEKRGGIPQVGNRIEPLAAIYSRTALSLARLHLENQRYAARHFAERCVELNLAAFIDLPVRHSCNFDNWNTQEDVSDRMD
jgi:molybdopterin-guanine dinucleotide biosynthesis protein A